MDDPKVYLLFDKIGLRGRALASVLLIFAGFAFQLGTKNILAGMPFIVACAILNATRGVSVKKVTPEKTAWEEVTGSKIAEVLEHCGRVKKFNSGNLGCCLGLVILAGFFVLVFSPLVEWGSLPFALTATAVDALVLFGGLILSGRKSAWMPHGLEAKARIVQAVMASPLVKKDPALAAAPYLEIGRVGDATFPNDARVLIRFKDAPDEFIGLQGQISINTVRSRAYPYFYIVLLARPAFHLFERYNSAPPDPGGLTVEEKKTEEVDVLVLRQTTTKTSGYHTDEPMQEHILAQAIKIARAVLRAGGTTGL